MIGERATAFLRAHRTLPPHADTYVTVSRTTRRERYKPYAIPILLHRGRRLRRLWRLHRKMPCLVLPGPAWSCLVLPGPAWSCLCWPVENHMALTLGTKPHHSQTTTTPTRSFMAIVYGHRQTLA